MKKLLTTAFVMSCAVASTFAASTSAKLRYNLPNGKTLQYDQVSKINMLQTVMGQEIPIDMESSGVMSLACSAAATPGDTKVQISFGEITMKMSGMAMGGVPDTTMKIDNGSDPIAEIIVTPKGKTTVQEKESSAPKKKSMIGNQLKNMTKSTMENLFFQFPETEVSKGTEWTTVIDRNQEVPGGAMTMTGTLKHTVEAMVDTLGRACVRIRSKSQKMSVKMNMKMQGMSISGEGDGDQSAVTYVDVKTGANIVNLSTVDFSLNLAISGTEDAIMAMEQKIYSSNKLKNINELP